MMDKFKFEGIGEVVVSIYLNQSVQPGTVVCMLDNNWAHACLNGNQFCGVALKRKGEMGSVQVKGFARVSYSGELKHGWKPLVADGNGGVREDANGIQRLVIQVDEEEHTAVICL